jgi:flagellar hook protein FlgE
VASQASGTALYDAGRRHVRHAGRGRAGAVQRGHDRRAGQPDGAQRNYQANTKVISSENEMMQALFQAV